MAFDKKRLKKALCLSPDAADAELEQELKDREITPERLHILEMCSGSEHFDVATALCGDVKGHEFHGNQHTGGGGGGGSTETGISDKELRDLKYKPAGGATGFSGKSAYKHFGKEIRRLEKMTGEVAPGPRPRVTRLDPENKRRWK